MSRLNAKSAGAALLDTGLTIGGAIAAAKAISFLDGKINPDGTSKMKGMIAPAAAAVIGVAGSIISDGHVKAVSRGIALSGAVKVAEKLLNKENLLGVDDQYDGRALALPGIGSFGQAQLPELPHYSENPAALPTTTGADPQYYMGQPSDVLSVEDEIIAY
jgi:hypothetical protein